MMTLSIGCLRSPFLVALDPMGVGSTSSSADDRETNFTPPSLPLSPDLELVGDMYCTHMGEEGKVSVISAFFINFCLIYSYTKFWQALSTAKQLATSTQVTAF